MLSIDTSIDVSIDASIYAMYRCDVYIIFGLVLRFPFQSFTAAQALMKFKRRLEQFRAKTKGEREAERMWAEMRNVRYLRIPENP